MTVSFLDVRAGYLELKSDIDAAVQRVLNSGSYILGDEVAAFETNYAAYCAADHCVAVANGFDALVLALRALNVGHGDEVIVPANTFIATWLAVSAVGATVVPVDPDPETYNITTDGISAAVTSQTRAVILVHLYGQPADVDDVLTLAQAHNFLVIEDAAQAQGARCRGRRIGAQGDAVCWSFYPGKNLGALGDAGAVTTNRSDVADRVKQLRNYGSSRKYVNIEKGVNSRLDPVQAAVLNVKLTHLDRWTFRRTEIAACYMQKLKGVTLPTVPAWADPVWHLYVIQHPDRDAFQSRLEAAGIMSVIHYPIPPHLQQAYADLSMTKGSFPISERLAERALSLPIGPHMSDDEVDQVVMAANSCV